MIQTGGLAPQTAPPQAHIIPGAPHQAHEGKDTWNMSYACHLKFSRGTQNGKKKKKV